MTHRLVDQWQRKAVPVARACALLRVSRSGYYAAKVRRKTPRLCLASVQLRAAFASSRQSYGSRRLVTALHAQGRYIGRYKVRRLMRQARLKPVWKKKFVCTTNSKHPLPVADNHLNRQFNPTRPNRAWVSDITYIRTRTGWLYLAVVLDLFSRKAIDTAAAEAS